MITWTTTLRSLTFVASNCILLQGMTACLPKSTTATGSDALATNANRDDVPLSGPRASIFPGSVKPNSPILIFADGLSTCGLLRRFNGDAFLQADRILESWKQKSGMTPGYVYSCYGTLNELFVSTSSNPRTTHLNDVSELFTIIANEVGTDASRPVALVGHSYGGWTVMKAILQLSAAIKVKALITSDPISRAECLPSIVAAELNPFSRQPASDAAPCLRSPKDVDSAQIKARVGSWLNLYENDFPLLHSSPIANADQNLLIKRDVLIKANAHVKMDADQRVWDGAASLILK